MESHVGRRPRMIEIRVRLSVVVYLALGAILMVGLWRFHPPMLIAPLLAVPTFIAKAFFHTLPTLPVAAVGLAWTVLWLELAAIVYAISLIARTGSRLVNR